MIHIATVHYETDKWIDIQLRYFKKYIKQPYRVYAFLSGDAIRHKEQFYFACSEPINIKAINNDHAVKLNLLAKFIGLSTNDKNDVIIFFDGDAFPIAPIDEFISETLRKYPLAAVQTLESLGDSQPHPCFCFTTIKFWEDISGDWKKGYQWLCNNNAKRSDTGGNLLKILNDNKIDWKKIHRTQQLADHGFFFGIYGNIVYHHGAGFRPKLSAYDIYYNSSKICQFLFNTSNIKVITLMNRILKRTFIFYFRSLTNKKNSDKIYNRLLKDEYLELD